MTRITQNKQMLYFHCGPQKNLDNKKKQKKELVKALKTEKQLVSKNNIN